MAKKGSSEFETLNQEPVSHRYLKVSPGPEPSHGVSVPRVEDLPVILCR